MIFSEACNQVGYNPDYSNAPTRIYAYFAYKDGQSFECFSKAEAQKIINHLSKEMDELKRRFSVKPRKPGNGFSFD